MSKSCSEQTKRALTGACAFSHGKGHLLTHRPHDLAAAIQQKREEDAAWGSTPSTVIYDFFFSFETVGAAQLTLMHVRNQNKKLIQPIKPCFICVVPYLT